jgi:hypothetical protein
MVHQSHVRTVLVWRFMGLGDNSAWKKKPAASVRPFVVYFVQEKFSASHTRRVSVRRFQHADKDERKFNSETDRQRRAPIHRSSDSVDSAE